MSLVSSVSLFTMVCLFGIAVIASVFECLAASDTAWTKESFPPLIRMVRIYGGTDERQPPILLINSRQRDALIALGSSSITIEVDIAAHVPPDLVVTLQHYTANWEPDNNLLTIDPTAGRAVILDWQLAPPQSRFYTHRATVRIPSPTLKVPVGGNWKALFYELGREHLLLAETRFFAVEPSAECFLSVSSDFYLPQRRVAPTARVLEAIISNVQGYTDGQVTSAVFYRMNRWYEPFMVRGTNVASGSTLSLRTTSTLISGMVGGIKRFRIEGIPAENEYRRLDVQNTALFPRSTTPIRLPIADVRRRGQFGAWTTRQAAMITREVSPLDDEYVLIEFILDPENMPVRDEEVFVVGSMNNWLPTNQWMMTYDSTQRLYRLRQWVRRGQHAYLYATGRIDADTGNVRDQSFEEFEGNTSLSTHVFVVFIYARTLQAGGYDTIIAVGSGSSL